MNRGIVNLLPQTAGKVHGISSLRIKHPRFQGNLADDCDYRIVEVDNRDYLYHIPTNSIVPPDDSRTLLVKDALQNGVTFDVISTNESAISSLLELERIGETPRNDDIHTVKRIAVSPTLKCNLNCTYCYNFQENPAEQVRNLPELDTAGIRRIVQTLAKLPVKKNLGIAFIGGEPLYDFKRFGHLVRLAVRYGKRHGFSPRFSVTTNGLGLGRDDVLSLINRYRITVSVSLDGPPEWHDESRKTWSGTGSYGIVTSILPRFFERYHSGTRSVRTTPRLIPGRLLKTYMHLVELGFNDIAMGSADFEAAPLEGINKTAILDEADELAKRIEADMFNGRILRFSWISEALINLFSGRAKAVVCGAARNYIAFDTYGNMQACHRYLGSSDEPLNVEDLIHRHESEKLGKIYEGGKTPDCHRCWARSLCGGECFHVAEEFRNTNELAERQQFMCDFKRTKFAAALRTYVRLWNHSPALVEKLVTA